MVIPKDLSQQRDQFLITTPMTDLKSVLNKFLQTQSVLHSEEILSRLVYEAIEDCYLDGIKLVEFRYAPTFIADGHPHLTFQKIVRAFEKGLKLASHFAVGVGFIGIFQRIKNQKTNEIVRDFFLDHRGHFIGVDLADDETFAPATNFKTLFEPFLKKGIPITIHAGEVPNAQSPQNVRDAIEILGATRIGHGLQIIQSPEIMEFVKAKKITLELCPTSNWLTRSVQELKSHPIQKLRDYGIPVTVSTDDPGIFDLTLTHEYSVLEKQFHWKTEDFKEVNQNALRASFLSTEIKNKFWSD